jgi:hypothetical protein
VNAIAVGEGTLDTSSSEKPPGNITVAVAAVWTIGVALTPPALTDRIATKQPTALLRHVREANDMDNRTSLGGNCCTKVVKVR